MASDFNKPVSTDNYLDLLTTIRDNQKALAKMFDGETVSNTPVGAIRWSSANGRLEKYNGTTWEALLPVATTSADGLMSSTDKLKLDGVAASANNYIHPTSDGDKHVPATSTTNARKGLIAGTTAGAFAWSDAMFGFEFVSVSTATTIAATHIGKMLRVTSAVALSVPTPTSLGLRNGESFVVVASVDNVVINRSSSTFAGSTGNENLTLNAHEYVLFTVISTTAWQVTIIPTAATSAETITGTFARKYTTPAGVKAAIDASTYVITKSDVEGVLTGEITSHTHRVGELVWATGATPLPGTIAANGATLSRTAYSRLWAYAQASGNISVDDASWTEGQYSPGDGSTTFRVPKVDDRFIRGKSATRDVGLVEEDAIRNITGEVSLHGATESNFISGTSGAFAGTGGSTTQYRSAGQLTALGGGSSKGRILLDASSKVPTADENRPKALTMLPCIVY